MTEQDFEIIEKYFGGQLSPQEKAAFQERLTKEEDLREQVAIFSSLQRGIKQFGRRDLRKHIFPPSNIPFTVRLSTVWKVAIPAVIVAVILIYRSLTPSTNEQLFLAYYAPADTVNFSTPRGESEDYTIKLNAFREFKAGRYEASLSLIKTLEGDEESSLLEGLNLIQLNRFPQAVTSLLKAKDGRPAISHAASWYLALVYLKLGQKENALHELDSLTGGESIFKIQAKQLIEQLK